MSEDKDEIKWSFIGDSENVNNSHEEIRRFVNEQKRCNTAKKTRGDLDNFVRE